MLKKTVILIILLTLVASISSKAEPQYKTYYNAKLGYQIDYPIQWNMSTGKKGSIHQFIVETADGDTLLIESHPLSEDLKKQAYKAEDYLEYANLMIKAIKDGAEKNGIEVAIIIKPSLYKTKQHSFIRMGIEESIFNIPLFFGAFYLIPSADYFHAIAFNYWTEDFGDQIESIVESFKLI